MPLGGSAASWPNGIRDASLTSCAGAGMNLFLKNLDITFRRDPTNYRPRINKHESTKDREQKLAGTYVSIRSYTSGL